MGLKVLIPQDITSPGKDFLVDKGYEVLITNRTDTESLCRDASCADAILARLCPYPAKVFESAPRLKVIARHGSGYNNVDVEAATKAGVWVCITPTAPANSVAEHAIALMLACARQIPSQDRWVRTGDWSLRKSLNCFELKGKTLGIIGFGRIGKLIAQKAYYGFGMEVLACSRHVLKKPYEYASHTTNMDEVLSRADIISVNLPSTPENHGLFDSAAFGKMKPGCVFINTSRGELVDEAALYEALKAKHISIAGLDVLCDETSTSENPLTKLPNVIFTLHSGGLAKEAMDQMGLMAVMEIHRVLSGEKPEWPVNSI